MFYECTDNDRMDHYDDIQIEELSMFDFVEDCSETFDEHFEKFDFDSYVKSNIDYW